MTAALPTRHPEARASRASKDEALGKAEPRRTESAASSPADREPRTVPSSPVRGDFSVTFDVKGDFAALEAATAWLKLRGFSVGAMQHNWPIAVMYGEARIGKWGTLSPEDHADLHGQIRHARGATMRSGPVAVHIRRDAPAAVIAAFRAEPEDLAARAHVEGVGP